MGQNDLAWQWMSRAGLQIDVTRPYTYLGWLSKLRAGTETRPYRMGADLILQNIMLQFGVAHQQHRAHRADQFIQALAIALGFVVCR